MMVQLMSDRCLYDIATTSARCRADIIRMQKPFHKKGPPDPESERQNHSGYIFIAFHRPICCPANVFKIDAASLHTCLSLMDGRQIKI